LLILRIDALGNGAHAYSEESKLLNDPRGIAHVASESAGVVEKEHVKRSRDSPGGLKKPFQAGPIRCCAGDRFIGVDLIGQNKPTEGQRRFLALADLVINGCRLLLIAAVPRIDRTPEAQG
jgi:hypothetical protein